MGGNNSGELTLMEEDPDENRPTDYTEPAEFAFQRLPSDADEYVRLGQEQASNHPWEG
jgi:hypothetical protein